MDQSVPLPLSTPAPAQSPRAAHRILNLICLLLVLTTVVGRAWDGLWHITYVFDSFWSPPHVFIYAMSAATGLLVAVVSFVPALRRPFGTGFPALDLPFDLPGPLFLLSSGCVALGIAGALIDNMWHTMFGLDETAWSVPHAMSGGALTVICGGYIAARLALRPTRPLRWHTTFVLALLLIGFSFTCIGPLYDQPTTDTIRAISSIPVLAQQPAAQHSYRILLDWNLTRTNPLALVACAFAAGCALALVRSLEPHNLRFLIIIGLWSLLNGKHAEARWLDQFAPTLHNPANWLPLPLLPAACVVVLGAWMRRGQRTTWLAAGLVFGLAMAVIWVPQPLGVLAALVAAWAMLLGARLGQRVFRVLEQPGEITAWALLLVLAVGLPLATGAVDLWLRTHTAW